MVHFLALSDNYPKSVKIANKYCGRKYNNKRYGGGIAFDQSQFAGIEDFKSFIKQISKYENT